MSNNPIQKMPLLNQWLWGFGSLGYALMERMLIVYVIFFYLPPREYQIVDLVTDEVYLGFFTVLGLALLFGRVVDGLADPFVATLSDKTKSRLGRRKPFMLGSALPLCVAAVLIFFPPHMGETSLLNGLWATVLWLVFYVFFTAYITPYFALISELGHTNDLRINFGTVHALFAILGMVIATIVFPLIVTAFQDAGMDLRLSYQMTAVIFGGLAMVSLYIATFTFNEKKHCLPAETPTTGMWQSIRSIYEIKAFKIFLIGELLLQFAIFMLNLGLLYYVVVIFQREESFLTILGGVTIGVALISFPIINKISKKVGKRKPILFGVSIMIVACFLIFALSWNMTGFAFYLGLAMFGLGGLTLSTCTILTLPVYADLAKEESLRTGVKREAMFYAARNLPLKITIALAGAVFAFLISAFGRDIAEPLGVQLTLLVIAVFSLAGFFFFYAYPEKEIQEKLAKYELSAENEGKGREAAG